jgi:hypothetical protein
VTNKSAASGLLARVLTSPGRGAGSSGARQAVNENARLATSEQRVSPAGSRRRARVLQLRPVGGLREDQRSSQAVRGRMVCRRIWGWAPVSESPRADGTRVGAFPWWWWRAAGDAGNAACPQPQAGPIEGSNSASLREA